MICDHVEQRSTTQKWVAKKCMKKINISKFIIKIIIDNRNKITLKN